MRLDQTYNIEELPADEHTLLPEGDYDVTILAAEVKPTSNGNGKYIELKMQVLGPSYKGAWLWYRINHQNANPDAQRIGRQQLRQLMEALGLRRLDDTDQFIGKTCIAAVKTRPAEGKYEASNEIKKIRASVANETPARPVENTAQTEAQTAPSKPLQRPW